MPSTTILKPDLAEDFYIVWINSAGGPGLWGTRAEVADAMARPASGYNLDDADPSRFDRADETGTSLLDPTTKFRGRVVDGRSWIARENMAAWCRSALDPRFLEPTEDDRRRAAAAEAMDG